MTILKLEWFKKVKEEQYKTMGEALDTFDKYIVDKLKEYAIRMTINTGKEDCVITEYFLEL